ncbi:MAG: xanthine dehydrogenase family protein molybdopterin-binding subunit [Phaeodactylibacter sp.]|nr:xanthine dehydrogenase family protein molybdopterin-binding subunit [Phaeodactylibacter sp.]
MQPIHRRQFLITTGYLSIGFTLFGCSPSTEEASAGSEGDFTLESPAGPLPGPSQIDAWLQVLEDGTVRVLTGKMELGQGLTVAIQQVAGEELNTSPGRVSVVLADTGRTPDEGITAGSRSMETSAMNVRRAAAAARERLLEMAAEAWGVEQNSLFLEEGHVKLRAKQEQLSFADLLKGRQLSAGIPKDISLKPKDQYQWVGRPVPHPDMEKMVRGEALYIQDMRLPEMAHARIVRPPVYGARLEGWDKAVEQMPGVLKIVENGSFLGVIAEEEYQAIKAQEALQQRSQWGAGPELPEVTSWPDYMLAQGGAGQKPVKEGENTHHAVYSKPYVMHGSIGPSCAVAAFQDGRLHIWSHTQGVYPLRATISSMTGLAEEDIRITGVRGSGCYGHNGADDVGADAALLAMAFPGRPVRLQWQRQDEHLWEPYGSAMRMELSARLGPDGKIEQWAYDLWTDSHVNRPFGDAGKLIAARYLADPFPFDKTESGIRGGARNSEPYYKIPDAKVKSHYVEGPLRVSALRSLGAYANVFAIESFMDELAEKAGRDALDFRIQHLDDERAVEVIRELKELTKDVPVASGEGMGYGFARYKNTASYCAVAAKVQVNLEEKVLRPIKMWAVIDAGEAINTDGLKNQTEGGMIQAASWTLMEEVRFNQREIASKDWRSYDIIRFDTAPETEVVVVNRPEQPVLGAGEAAQGPSAAGIANAVYAACGKRVRELPVKKGLFG